MSVKTEYEVKRIKSNLTYEWLLKKHYAKRLPLSIPFAFGLYFENRLVGVCTFGAPAPPVPITIFGRIGAFKVHELTRLVVNENLGKNVLSYFVSNSLKQMPKPCCIVSYSDMNFGHHGYIYQATNWVYTGVGGKDFSFKDKNGKFCHELTLWDMCRKNNLSFNEYLKLNKIQKIRAKGKHRYIYLLGNKNQKKQMIKEFKLKPQQYPKGENSRYNADYDVSIQTELF